MSGKEEPEVVIDQVKSGWESDEWKELIQNGEIATRREHTLSVREALRTQWKACLWASALSCSIVMLGYDNSLIGNFWGYPAFQKKYGTFYPGIGYQVPAKWQVALPDTATVGIILGSQLNGFLTAKFGYRKVMISSLILIIGLIFIPFFAPSVQVLLVAEIFCGFQWGIYATSSQSYASEVCPVALRGFLTSYVNLSQITGQLIATGVLEGLVGREDQWSYRIPFAIQWIWPIPIMLCVYFAPESPWYLARYDRLDEAERSLKKLSTSSDSEIKETLAMIVHTTQYEREMTSGTGYLDCFRGVNLRRTEISCLVFVGQVTCGIFMMDPGTYFWEQAGLTAKNSYKVTVGATAVGFPATIIGSILQHIYGRRRIYVTGLFSLTGLMVIIGILAVAGNSSSLRWAQVALTIVWVVLYNLTIGPSAYAISSETSAVKLRVKTVCLSKITHQLTDIVAAVLEPYMMNPTQWNWKGKTAFFWAGLCFLSAVWSYFRVPETRGRTYEELDVLFDKKISARKFENYIVDAYGSGELIVEKDKESVE